MLATAGELVERFRTRDPLKGTLRLGVNETFAFICLPELLQRIERRYPAIRTSVFVGDTGVGERATERSGARHRGRVGADGRAARLAANRSASTCSGGSRARR